MWHNIYITVIKYHKSYSGAGGPTFLYNLKCPNVAITRIEVFYIFFSYLFTQLSPSFFKNSNYLSFNIIHYDNIINSIVIQWIKIGWQLGSN